MPRVSVIIPALNAEAHLGETLRSVAAQGFDDWEVVLADDGSSDRTVEVAEGFGPRVKVLTGSGNTGPSAARNRAIDASTGELLAFLDADDYWLPNYLAEQVDTYDSAGRADAPIAIVAGDARVLGPEGFLPDTFMDLVGYPDVMTLARLLEKNPMFVSAVVAPRGVVDEAGSFCLELSGAADYDLWIRIVELRYRVVATREPVAVYRRHPGSMSADAGSMARDAESVYRRALERGNLSAGERRIARRELRRNIAIGQISTADGVSYRRAVRALPLLVRVAAEHPGRWRSLPRMLRRGRSAFSSYLR